MFATPMHACRRRSRKAVYATAPKDCRRQRSTRQARESRSPYCAALRPSRRTWATHVVDLNPSVGLSVDRLDSSLTSNSSQTGATPWRCPRNRFSDLLVQVLAVLVRLKGYRYEEHTHTGRHGAFANPTLTIPPRPPGPPDRSPRREGGPSRNSLANASGVTFHLGVSKAFLGSSFTRRRIRQRERRWRLRWPKGWPGV
jgi:hypothetical protein